MTRPVAAGLRPGARVDDGNGAMGPLDRLAGHRAQEEGRHCAETPTADDNQPSVAYRCPAPAVDLARATATGQCAS